MYTVKLSKGADKTLSGLDKRDQQRIILALGGLEQDPFVGKKLQGRFGGMWSVRVVPYRIIYSIDKKIVTVNVVAIGDRKDVYKKLK
ncbi:type II toxin-antitoxin system RelE/ParE family toxin [Patescibacteria group bacterium]|nr:type II toxin-antitoxin system RelE/ParE family toxin [Patescibacteria group bacterium]MBU1123210.1 type II toxin-antitoxin system RelE/ParE family toxin [Patescibacteria group bacterium]MBU1910794.1 type II toxin-antitoxin system RelE/ParE family toxin [Patescibacteria group bacterium]